MKIIKTEAVDPRPVQAEGTRAEVEEIFIFDITGEKSTFIGTEWRVKEEIEVPTDG